MDKIILTDNYKTSYHICTNQYGDSASRYAARELQKYLYEATDTLIPLFSDKCEKRSAEILVGEGARGITKDARLEKGSSEAYIIKRVDRDIHIYGNSGRATLYAVYRFLEDYVGFRCFASDEIKVEKIKKIEIETLDIFQDFSFEYREVYFNDSFDGSFASKNMLNSNLARISEEEGGKTKWFNCHHSFSDLVSPSVYFDSHPEYFSLVDGARRKEHTELCLSNEDVFNIALKKVNEWIDNNPNCKVFSVAQDEWMGHFIKMACECENCKKIDEANESQSGSIITFVNRIANEVKKTHPDVLIHTFAYQYSRKPPKVARPADNVIVRLTNIECSWGASIEEEARKDENSRGGLFYKDLIGWSKITNRLYIWDYAVNYRNYLLPFPCFRSMAKNIELYKKVGVKGLLMQGNFSYGGGGYMDEAKAYVASHLMRDDHKSLDELIEEFAYGYYGPSAPKIIEYINLWEDAVIGHDLWLYDDADSSYFTDSVINKATVILNEAKLLCDKEHLKRLEKVILGLDYLKIVSSPLDEDGRNAKIDAFYAKVRYLKITELMERTPLDLSIRYMKDSRYAKERPDWYSLYYIMK